SSSCPRVCSRTSHPRLSIRGSGTEPDDVASSETVARPVAGDERTSESPLRRTLIRFRRHRLAMVGLIIIVILVVGAIVIPEKAAYDQELFHGHQPPSPAHWFGTDAIGRDVFARTLLGGRVSLVVGHVSALVLIVIGFVVGSPAVVY